MTLTHEINMDLIRRGDTPRISAVQGDRGSREMLIRLFADGCVWNPPEDVRALIRYRRPDGTDGVYDYPGDGSRGALLSGNTLRLSIIPEILRLPGAVRMAVTLVQGEQELTTFPILILVQPSYGAQATESGGYISVAGLLPAPQGVSPGQFLVVDQVDNNGTALAVKGVDSAGGSGGIPGESGAPGEPGAPGKSAYDYALEGGFEGTEEEFSEKMAREYAQVFVLRLAHDADTDVWSADKSFADLLDAYEQGMILMCRIPAESESGIDSALPLSFVESSDDGWKGFYFISSSHSLEETVCLGNDGSVVYSTSQLPKTMPNPNTLTLRIGTGAAKKYDGSSAVSVNVVSMKNPQPLVLNGVEYDGSEKVELTAGGNMLVVCQVMERPEGQTYHLCAPDKTYEEILMALDGGQMPCCALVGTVDVAVDSSGSFSSRDFTGRILPLSGLLEEQLLFSGIEAAEGAVTQVTVALSPDSATVSAESRCFSGSTADSGQTVTVLSDNLFDKTSVISGQVCYPDSSGPQLVEDSTGFCAYVPLRGAGNYRMKVSKALHGDYAFRIPLLKEDKTFIRNVTAALVDSSDTSAEPVAEFTITASDIDGGAAMILYDGALVYLDSLMIVKDRDYPDIYIPYGYIESTQEGSAQSGGYDPLRGKTALFLGDSICAGTTVGDFSQHRGFGWAGLIGEEHGMVWRNFGRNGGTVTPLDTVAQGLWLTTQADSALAEYPKADYVIFEGGCNDADRLDLAGLGALASGGYAPESDEDFTGAFETLILKLVTSFPNARLGYIVAPKMGTAGDYGSGTNRYRKFFDRAVEICEKWGIPVLDLWKESPLNPMLTAHFDSALDEAGANEAGKFYTDGQHLTLAGYKRISPKIASWMAGL